MPERRRKEARGEENGARASASAAGVPPPRKVHTGSRRRTAALGSLRGLVGTRTCEALGAVANRKPGVSGVGWPHVSMATTKG